MISGGTIASYHPYVLHILSSEDSSELLVFQTQKHFVGEFTGICQMERTCSFSL